MNLRQKEFQDSGFVIVPDVLDKNEVSKFRSEMDAVFKTPFVAAEGDTFYVRSNVFNRYQHLQKYFFRPQVIDAIRDILGEDFYLMPEVSISVAQYGNWHKDTTSVELFGFDFHKRPDFKVLNGAFYLQDNADFGGGLDVVPGSHLTSDTFTEHYRSQSMTMQSKAKELPPSQGLKGVAINVLKKGLPFVYSTLKKRQERIAHLNSIPTVSSDTWPGRHTIPSKAGDLVLFDLRLDHKASWPKGMEGFTQQASKYACFVICGTKNQTSVDYKNYLFKRAESQHAYAYLKQYRPSAELIKSSTTHNISLL